MKEVVMGLGALLLVAPLTLAQPEAGKDKMVTKEAKPAGAKKPKGVAYLRILHAVPDAPAADVYLDGKKVAEGTSFKSLIDYLPIDSGKTAIKLTPAGKTDVLFEASQTAARDGYMTAAVYGTADKPMLLANKDNAGKSDEKKARIRVFHLAPGAPNVDVTTPSTRAKDGSASVIKNLAYGKDAAKLVAPGKITLQVRVGDKILKEVPDVTLEAGKKYAIFAVGKVGGDGAQAFDVLVKPMGK